MWEISISDNYICFLKWASTFTYSSGQGLMSGWRLVFTTIRRVGKTNLHYINMWMAEAVLVAHRETAKKQVIDCFSKYAWLLPITQKKAEKVLEVLCPFLKEHTPKVLQSDNGGKFTNAQMKELLEDLHIKHITSLPYKPSSNGQVERFNRMIKSMIMQYMAASNSRRYLDVLPKIVDNYNNTYHTTIKSTPPLQLSGQVSILAEQGKT